ncbi:hypothetical protein N7462_009093 [Penicillium macrosclerotiorum]|uniref:uncharacterized protein n=1 Tax=Penicillium macrosclerotiorum TaxID=303699 RepID=UPI0025485B34|nr:uncharacterized protein N7462_009093 [Penicillium macrosclerotiorum]KAJ5676196.1 hypothetical protein N7462_009093 [Penicillium macrosclerotiorum]
MKLSIFLPLAAFLAMTAAEMAKPVENVSPCLNHCLTEAAAVAGCISQYDTKCTCTSPAMRDTTDKCLKAACTKEDGEAALALHQKRCGTTPDENDD